MFLSIREGLDEALALLKKQINKSDNGMFYEMYYNYFLVDTLAHKIRSKHVTSSDKLSSTNNALEVDNKGMQTDEEREGR